MSREIYLLVCALLLLVGSQVDAQRGSSCRTPNGEWARCTSIYECKRLLAVIRTMDSKQLRFLKESQCGYDTNVLVCCGSADSYSEQREDTAGRTLGNAQFTRNRALPTRINCGFQEIDRIYHGNETSLDEFPWMALLQYRNASGTKKWGCAGSLINSRYVLTAAHCVTGLRKRTGTLINVRLGEYNTMTDIDCKGPRVCNQPPVDIAVESVIFHSDYETNNRDIYNDIALVRLSRPVSYSNFIRPICLPEPDEAANDGKNVIVAGWGATDKFTSSSPTKLKLQLPIVNREQCSKVFKTAGVRLRDTQICAGGERGKDSCTGDSGGPLMVTSMNDSTQWYLEGIVSFGSTCGTEGWPGIYTKVVKYLQWIHSSIRD